MVNNIIAQTTKPELAQYFHAEIYIPTTTSLQKANNTGFLKTWMGLTEGLINKHIEKLINTTMGNLHMRRQVTKPTGKKPTYTDLEDKCNVNVGFCTTVEPITSKEGKIYSELCGRLSITTNKINK